jgi:hypothetical protein
MGWQCAIVSIAYLAGTIIQGLIVLNRPDYDFQRWHGTMLVIAISTFSILFNTFLAKNLPFVEGLILIIHVIGLFAIIIPLWVLAPRDNAHAVFTTFNNGGGWNNAGTATLVGLSTTITSMLGYDCSVHMCKKEPYERPQTWYIVLIFKSRRNQRRIRDTPKGNDVLCRRQWCARIHHASHIVLHTRRGRQNPRYTDGIPIHPDILQHHG